jgi:hypothetical protein
MKGKAFIVPILIIALVTFFAAPPVQAEFVTLTVVLLAGLITTGLAVETVRSNNDDQTDQKAEQEETLTADSDVALSAASP